MTHRLRAVLCLIMLCTAAAAAELPHAPRLSAGPDGTVFGGVQLAPGDDGEYVLFTAEPLAPARELGRYSGRLAGTAVGRYDKRLWCVTRDGTLTACGDDADLVIQGDSRWHMADLAWHDDALLALDRTDQRMQIVRANADAWEPMGMPGPFDADVQKCALVSAGGALHLVWSGTPGDMRRGALRRMTWADGVWTEQPGLPLGEVLAFAAFAWEETLAVAALLPPPLGADGPNTLCVRVWRNDAWKPAPELDAALPSGLAQNWDIAAAGDAWLVAGLAGAKAYTRSSGWLALTDPVERNDWTDWAAIAFLGLFVGVAAVWCVKSRSMSAMFPGSRPDLTSRSAALAVDWMLVSVAIGTYHWAVGDLRIYMDLLTLGMVSQLFWVNLGALALFTFIFETWLGQTPGKWLTGLRVRSIFGGPPNLLQVGLRSAARFIDMFPLMFPGIIGAVYCMCNPHRRRIGDSIGGTVVVRHAPVLQRRFLLASKSPRRKELLDALGVHAEVRPSDVDESAIRGENPAETVRLLAEAKAKAATTAKANIPAGEIIIAADTMVVLDNVVLGKPRDADEAKSMLRSLSGRSHQVVTGVTLLDTATGQGVSGTETTDVEFRTLDDHEIDMYIQTGDPMDKAGAYGVQTCTFIRQVRGSVSNVAGLPMELLQWLMTMLDS